MKLNGSVAGLFGTVISAALALIYYSEISMAGFPDGHLTDYSRAFQMFFFIMLVPGLALALYFFNLALTASKHASNKKLWLSVLILISYIAIYMVVDNYLYFHLDHGQGG